MTRLLCCAVTALFSALGFLLGRNNHADREGCAIHAICTISGRIFCDPARLTYLLRCPPRPNHIEIATHLPKLPMPLMAKRPMLHISMVLPVTTRLFITSISRFSPKPILKLIKKLKKLSGQLPENVSGSYDTVGGTFNRPRDLENEKFWASGGEDATGEEEAEVEVLTEMAAEFATLSPLKNRRHRFKLIAAGFYKDELHKCGQKP
ncbi:hypothetical protein B0H19DRAFT_1072458 [Mycena capillaripes]|nr:hypothetical protein B0H19DRAFT_1072458 [Mycena capillaripes]